MSSPLDILKEFAEIDKLRADEAALEQEFARLTRKLFTLGTGRKWVRHAMAKYNFMGSVFAAEDGMDPSKAMLRDGMRHVISDILNNAFSSNQPDTDDDDDDDPHV